MKATVATATLAEKNSSLLPFPLLLTKRVGQSAGSFQVDVVPYGISLSAPKDCIMRRVIRVPNMAMIGLKVSPNKETKITVNPVISERAALKQQAI
jgi:hypothetical protein